MANDSLMTPLEKAVWGSFSERFAGVENLARRKIIIVRFNLKHLTLAVSDRVLRDTVLVLVKVYTKAICTTLARGYFIARTVSEKKVGSTISARCLPKSMIPRARRSGSAVEIGEVVLISG